MNPNDELTYVDDFNPLEWAMNLYKQADNSEHGVARREFMFDSPMSASKLKDAHVCWHYYQKVINYPHPELNRIVIIINKENTHIVGFAKTDGFTKEDMKKYFGGVTNGRS